MPCRSAPGFCRSDHPFIPVVEMPSRNDRCANRKSSNTGATMMVLAAITRFQGVVPRRDMYSSSPKASVYCQFCISPRGTLFDAKGKRREWDGAVEWAVKRRAEGWCLEMRIPFQDIDLATPAGALLRANVFRMRRAGGSGEPSGWSPVRRAFNDPSRFGYVLLGSPRAHLRRVFAREEGAFDALHREIQARFEKHPAIGRQLGPPVAEVRRRWLSVRDKIGRADRVMTGAEWRTTYEALIHAGKELRQLGIKIEFEIVLE